LIDYYQRLDIEVLTKFDKVLIKKYPDLKARLVRLYEFKRKRGVIFITPAKWFLFFVILKNKDIRKIAITLRLRFEYLKGKRNS